MLTDRKTRLEATIRALENERAGLVAQIEATALTDDQIASIVEFAAALAPGLAEAEEDLSARRVLIEKLRMQVTLTAEDGQRVVYGECVLGKDKLGVLSPSIKSRATPSLANWRMCRPGAGIAAIP